MLQTKPPYILADKITTRYFLDPEFTIHHRTDGPAIIRTDGHKEWRINGNLHRIGAPAVEWADGSKSWYEGGQPHRLDGPAIDHASGHQEWWITGEQMSYQEYARRTGTVVKVTMAQVEALFGYKVEIVD